MKLFEMKHIKKSFDGLEVLKDISLDVEEGEVLSIIGPSGSGKSTILRCATGLETPDSGEIIKNGGEVRFRTPLTGVSVKNGALTAVQADGQDIACERAVLAIGHSARDTFAALHGNGVYFEP